MTQTAPNKTSPMPTSSAVRELVTRLRAFEWTPARRVLAAAVLAGGALALSGFAYSSWHDHVAFESTSNAYVKGDLTLIAPKVGGYVLDIATENNRKVFPGQALLQIDPRDYEAAVHDAEAAVSQVEAAMLQLSAQEALQGAQIRAAGAAVAGAAATSSKAEADQARSDALIARGAISRQVFDQTRAENLRADAGLDQARASADLAMKQLGVLRAQRAGLQAQLQSARARLDRARNDLGWTTVTAPREGLVAARSVRVGEYVQPGTRLMAIAPTQGLWIEANLRETQLGRMSPGDRVQISVDAVPDRRFCGRVESISGASASEFAVIPPDNATGNFTKIVRRFPVRIQLDPGQPGLGRLGAGMSVETRIALESAGDGRAHGGLLARLFLGRFACNRSERP